MIDHRYAGMAGFSIMFSALILIGFMAPSFLADGLIGQWVASLLLGVALLSLGVAVLVIADIEKGKS